VGVIPDNPEVFLKPGLPTFWGGAAEL